MSTRGSKEKKGKNCGDNGMKCTTRQHVCGGTGTRKECIRSYTKVCKRLHSKYTSKNYFDELDEKQQKYVRRQYGLSDDFKSSSKAGEGLRMAIARLYLKNRLQTEQGKEDFEKTKNTIKKEEKSPNNKARVRNDKEFNDKFDRKLSRIKVSYNHTDTRLDALFDTMGIKEFKYRDHKKLKEWLVKTFIEKKDIRNERFINQKQRNTYYRYPLRNPIKGKQSLKEEYEAYISKKTKKKTKKKKRRR